MRTHNLLLTLIALLLTAGLVPIASAQSTDDHHTSPINFEEEEPLRVPICPVCPSGKLYIAYGPWGTWSRVDGNPRFHYGVAEYEMIRTRRVFRQCDRCGFRTEENPQAEFKWNCNH